MMTDKQMFKNWLRYLLCFFIFVLGCSLLSCAFCSYFGMYFVRRDRALIMEFIILTGFLLNLLICVFKLRKKYPIPQWAFNFYVVIHVLGSAMCFFNIVSDI